MDVSKSIEPGSSTISGRVFTWGKNMNYKKATVPGDAASTGIIKQIASGLNHMLALTKDGRVIAWGSADILKGWPAFQGVQAVAAGSTQSLLLHDNGTVNCLGYTWASQCDVPLNVGGKPLVAQQIAASQDMSCAKLPQGSWVCWGMDVTVDSWFPRNDAWRVPGGEAFHVLIPSPTPTAWLSLNGSRGRNSTTNNTSSSNANFTVDITSVTLNADKQSFLMLESATGRLHRRFNPQLVPSEVQEANISRACTWYLPYFWAGTSCWPVAAAVSDDGHVWAWRYGGPILPAPAKAQGRTQSVTCGQDLFIAILDDGDVAAWGPMVDAGVLPPLPTRAELASGGGVVSAAAGYDFAVLLLANGTAVPVGGPLGFSNALLPAALLNRSAGSPNITAMHAGFEHAVVILSDGQLVAFGDSWATAVPQAVRDAAARVNGILTMASGGNHMLALLPDGSIAQW
jgi:hypothetical protein